MLKAAMITSAGGAATTVAAGLYDHAIGLLGALGGLGGFGGFLLAVYILVKDQRKKTAVTPAPTGAKDDSPAAPSDPNGTDPDGH